MKLKNLLVKRYTWQNNTIETIKNNLLLKPTIVSVSHNKDSEKIVVIYGKPQVGKTTLILYLLGISSKHYKRVYDILRADIPRGNSSTSTAIIYQITDSAQFGMCFSDVTSISKEKAKFYSDDEFKTALKKVRSNVENGHQTDEILYIYIPKEYIDEKSVNFSNINIIDMPGDGSRNEKESFHVKVLLKKYLAMATVNIVVCKANEIQSLETQSFEHCPNWYCLNNRYIIITTNSFSQGSVKSYFKCLKNKRKTNFYEHVKKMYSSELKKVFSGKCDVEIYPTDIGDSLDRLINNELSEPADKKEAKETSLKMADEIRKAIQSRRGNELKSIIMDLKQIVNNYATGLLLEYQDELLTFKEEIKGFKALIAKNSSIIERNKGEAEKYKNQIQRCCHIREYRSILAFSEEEENFIDELIKSKSTFFWKKFYDKSEEVRAEIIKQIQMITQQAIDSAKKECDEEDILFATYDEFIREITEYLSFQQSLWNILYPDGRFKSKISIRDCLALVHKKMNSYSKEVNKMINETINSYYIELEGICQNQYDMVNALIKQKENDLSSYKYRLDISNAKLADMTEKIYKIEEIKRTDNELLENYIKEAKKQFALQKNKIYSFINSKENAPEDIMLYIIYLGILEKDFKRIAGESNEERQ